MDWVKLSTRYYLDPAVASLPDADSELMFVRGLAYCGAEETGGFIPQEIVPSLIRRRRHGTAVEALVARSLWVPSQGDRGQPGYRVARWEDWQEELEALARRRAADRERKRRERSKAAANGQVKGMSRDVSAGLSADSPHPESKSQRQKDSGGTGSQSIRAREWLRGRYRLIDDEADRVIAEVQARAKKPIGHLTRYLSSMAMGDLADIVAAVLDAAEHPSQPLAVVPDWCGGCDERTRMVEVGDDGRPKFCPDCHPSAHRETA